MTDQMPCGVKVGEWRGKGGDPASPNSTTTRGFRETSEPSWAPAVLTRNQKS